MFHPIFAGLHAQFQGRLLIFLLVRDLFDPLSAAIAAATYSVMAASPSLYGTAAHATHFVVLFDVAGVWVLWKAVQSGRAAAWFGASVLLGIAMLMKQHAVFLLGMAGIGVLAQNLFAQPRSWRRFLIHGSLCAAGGVLPYAIICLWLWSVGVFDRFWFWTFQYAREYTGMVHGGLIAKLLWFNTESIVRLHWPLLALAAAGAVAAARTDKDKPGRRWMVFSWLGLSTLCVCPGFLFRNHYFVVLLPVVALLAGAGGVELLRLASKWRTRPLQPPVSSSPNQSRVRRGESKAAGLGALQQGSQRGVLSWFVGAALAGAMLLPVLLQTDVFFQRSPEAICRRQYWGNPFIECRELAEYLKAHSQPSDRVAVIGSEPQIYFYANRLSATGYIYMYGLMELQPLAEQMQTEMIREIEAVQPEFMVFVSTPLSWLVRRKSNTGILKWTDAYLRRHYRVIGVMDVLGPEQTESRWGDEAAAYKPVSMNFLLLFRRVN